MDIDFITEFKANSIVNLEENTPRIKQCFGELTEQEVWVKPNGSLNSMGNLVLHLCGNMTQYIICALGGDADNRERDKEFAATGGYTKDELMHMLSVTVAIAAETIRHSLEPNLLKVHAVQGFELTGIGIINHVCNHYSYHTGQIAFWTKMLKEKDLAFYGGLDLNKRNG